MSISNKKVGIVSASIVTLGIMTGALVSNLGITSALNDIFRLNNRVVELVDMANRTLKIGSLNITGANGTATTTQEADFYSIGGVDYASVQQSFTGATTTPCSIRNPWNAQGVTATTSLMAYSMQITVGTSTASAFDLGTSTTAYATTTNLVSGHSVASGKQTYLQWSPSGSQNAIVAPTEWVNLKTVGAGLSGYTYTGTCNALFMKP